jgi:hypothetical protein
VVARAHKGNPMLPRRWRRRCVRRFEGPTEPQIHEGRESRSSQRLGAEAQPPEERQEVALRGLGLRSPRRRRCLPECGRPFRPGVRASAVAVRTCHWLARVTADGPPVLARPPHRAERETRLELATSSLEGKTPPRGRCVYSKRPSTPAWRTFSCLYSSLSTLLLGG